MMNNSYPTDKVPASAEYVLSVIRDNHRQQCQFDFEADPNVVLSFDTTIAEWRYACDLLHWRKLARAINHHWSIECNLEQWRAVLEPPKKRTLRDVCELIDAHAVREVVRPMRILGTSCETAGVFLTVRSLLGDAGADTATIAPSTNLAPYARRYLGVFLGPVSRLAPDRLRPVKIHKPLYWGALLVLFLGLCLLGLAAMIWGSQNYDALTIVGVLLFAVCYSLTWIAAVTDPTAVEFGDLRTFRDLAISMSAPTREGQSRA